MRIGGIAAVAAVPAVPVVAAAAIDADTVQLISLIVSSGTAVVLAWLSLKTAALNKSQAKVIESQDKVVESQDKVVKSQIHVEEKIGELEKNTNSMKDELVRTTKLMSHQEGVVAGKAVADAEQALIAKGELAGRTAMSEPGKGTPQPAAQATAPAPATPVAPPVIVVENVTADTVEAKTVRAGTLTTGHKKEEK